VTSSLAIFIRLEVEAGPNQDSEGGHNTVRLVSYPWIVPGLLVLWVLRAAAFFLCHNL